ncbi:hypothetical protein [Candidatus Lokiarchaeum ossiferum]|uniref:hypothetical protein n=1 Tax=Candidatus Lokiarchaeum ossiferum TaxID=2951803 RepID=UPI00352EDFE9
MKSRARSIYFLIFFLSQFGVLNAFIPLGVSNPIMIKPYNVNGPSFEVNNTVYLQKANVEINCSNGKAICNGNYYIQNPDNNPQTIKIEFKNDFIVQDHQHQRVISMTVDGDSINFSGMEAEMIVPSNSGTLLEIYWEYDYIFTCVSSNSFLFYSKDSYYITGYVINGGRHWGENIEEEIVKFNIFDNNFLNPDDSINVLISNESNIRSKTYAHPWPPSAESYTFPDLTPIIDISSKIQPHIEDKFYSYEIITTDIDQDMVIQLVQIKSHRMISNQLIALSIVCVSGIGIHILVKKIRGKILKKKNLKRQ